MHPGSNNFAIAFSASHLREEVSYVNELKTILRKQLTWLLLVCYGLMLLRPAMPVFADVVAHAFYEEQHMLTVHEVNGVFHVHNEVVKNAHQTDKDKSANTSKIETADCLIVNSTTPYLFSKEFFTVLSLCAYRCFYCFPFQSIDTPPPNVK